MALDAWRPADGAEHVPMGSVDAALAALRAGDIDAAMVPIENSVEGGVSATLDALATGEPLVVIGEVLVPITFVLVRAGRYAARPGPHRRHPLARVGPGARLDGRSTCPTREYVPTLSTAASAAALAAGRGRSTPGCAPPSPRSNEGLEVLAEDIGDNAAAVTRFVLVARPGHAARADRRRQDHRRALPARGPRRAACSSCSSSSPSAAST